MNSKEHAELKCELATHCVANYGIKKQPLKSSDMLQRFELDYMGKIWYINLEYKGGNLNGFY